MYINKTNITIFIGDICTQIRPSKIALWISLLTLGKQQRSHVQLSERLASVDIMGDQVRVSLKLPVHHNTVVLNGLRGVPTYAEKRQSLGQQMQVFFQSDSAVECEIGPYFCGVFPQCFSSVYIRPINMTDATGVGRL